MARLRERRGRQAEPARPAVRGDVAAAAVAGLRATGLSTLGMSELETVLTSYGTAVLPSKAVETAEEAATAAERLGFPVALKLRSPDISHKTDVGGVCLGLQTPAEVAAATTAMLARVRAARPEARIDGVLVQPMAPHGKELLLGMIRDPQFGPMVVVGFGGIYVEILKDTAARLCPLDRCEALDMLAELRMAPLLDGARGEPPVNKDRLAEAICRFAQLAVDATDVAELEVNPLVAGPDGVVAVDARARME
jgi:acyl-CoA synthetase (NDP forming)